MGNLCVPGGAAEVARPGELVLQGLMVKAWMDLNGNKDPNGTLPLPGLRRLLRRLAICLSAEELKQRFELFDKDCNGKISFADAWEFLRSCLSVPLPELEELFLTFARESELMPVAAFAHLLVVHQHQIRKGSGAPNAALARVLNIRSIIRRRANQRNTPLSRLAAATHENRTSVGLSSAGIDEQLCYNLRQGCVPTLLNEGRAGADAGRQGAAAAAGGLANPLVAATARASARKLALAEEASAEANGDGDDGSPAPLEGATGEAAGPEVSAAQLVAMRLKAQADGHDTVSLREATNTVIAGHGAEAALSRRRVVAGSGAAGEQTPQAGSKAAAILLGSGGGDSHSVVEAGRADEEEELRTLRVLAESIDDARPGISFLEFLFYMTEPVTNGLGNPRIVNTTWQNMKRPLSSYFICTARQAAVQDLQQRAVSVAALRRCVALGARALELELAELQDKDGIHRLVVCPPRAGVTSKLRSSQCLSLRETMAVAVEAAFSKSPFPLVLLLRSNISSQRGQEALAKQLRQIFGGVLHTSQEERQRLAALRGSGRRRSTAQRVQPAAGDQLPSPFELRERVLLFLESSPGGKGPESIHPALASTVFSRLSAVQEVELDDSGAVQLPKLAAVGEEAVLRVGERGPSNAAAMLRATHSNLLFVEPSPTRIMSRNQPAEPLWNLGAQMVGCNFFNCDMRTLVYHSFFQNNGGCGYVLKPAFMQPRHTPSAYDASGRDTAVRQRLTLRIISAQNLPVLSTITSQQAGRRKSLAGGVEAGNEVRDADLVGSRVVAGGLASAISPVVEVRITGAKCDCKTFTTEAVENNGYNPRWGGSPATGSVFELELRRPEMAVVSFIVRHQAGARGATPFLAYGGTPAPAILPGIRCIQLFDACSAPLPRARLFVRVERSAGTAARGPSYKHKY